MNQIVFSAHTHVNAFSFAALSLSATHPARRLSLTWCILKLARYLLRKLCWLLIKRLDVLGAELKENHLTLYIKHAIQLVLGRFPFVRTGWPDHYATSRFDNEIRFFREFLPNNHFLGAYYLGFDWSGWRDLIKMEILIALGMVWPVSSDKWKAPLVYTWMM